MTSLDLDELITDKSKFGKVFKKPKEWAAWLAFMKAFHGAPMTEAEWSTFRECTGRQIVPEGGFDDAVLIIGRRAGKSFISSFLASLAALTYESDMPGDMPQIFIVGENKRAARVNLSYVEAFCECVPGAIKKRNKESIELFNGVEIRSQALSFRSTRGYSLIFLACEEVAQWRSDESANPDVEVLRALEPALEPGAKTIITSTPFARKGLLYDLFKKNYGKETDTLVWWAPTLRMRPNFDERKIRRAIEKDPISANTEYNAQWRDDITSWLPEPVIEDATGPHFALPCQPGVQYKAAVDASGGRSDAYCLAIAHDIDGVAVVDLVEERKAPLDPLQVTREFARICKGYNVGKVVGDRYAGNFLSSAWLNEGIFYETASIDKSEAFLQFAAVMSMRKALIPRNEQLKIQLVNLERKALPSGKEQVASPENLHDDLANAVALVVVDVYKGISSRMTPEQMEARMPVMKKHPKQTAQEAIREYNREFARENNLMISVSDARKMRFFR